MSVPEQTPRVLFDADGVLTNFALPYELIDLDTDFSRGVDNLLVYEEPPQTDPHPIFGTVDGSVQKYQEKDWLYDFDTDEIVFFDPPASGNKICILRETYETQEADYQDSVEFLIDGGMEYVLDKITHRMQELNDIVRRSLYISPSKAIIGEDGFAYVRIGLYFPARIVSVNGGGSYSVRELILDDGEWRDKDADDLDGVFFSGTAHEFNLCDNVTVGSQINVHIFKIPAGSVVYRFIAPGCVSEESSSSSSSSSSSYYSSSSSSSSSQSQSSSVSESQSESQSESASESQSQSQSQSDSSSGSSGTIEATFTIADSQVPGDLTDFVVLLRGSDLVNAQWWAGVTSDGGNIRAYKSDGTTELPMEIVFIDTIAENFEIWVKYSGTLSSSTPTPIILRIEPGQTLPDPTSTYGRNNVWTDYVLVLHFQESANNNSNGYLDSTGNGYHGTGVSMAETSNAIWANGSIGSRFDGSNDYISLVNYSGELSGNVGSITSWIQSDQSTPLAEAQTGIWLIGSSGANEASHYSYTDGNIYEMALRPSASRSTVGTGSASRQNWTYISITSQSGAGNWIYSQNGSSVKTETGGSFSLSSVPKVGRSTGSSGSFNLDGNADEFRVSASVLSPNRITTEYNNQSNPSSFYSVT